MSHSFFRLQTFVELRNFDLWCFRVESQHLKNNLLGDSSTKNNLVLLPKKSLGANGRPFSSSKNDSDLTVCSDKELTVSKAESSSVVPPSMIFLLSGLAGNGTFSLNQKFAEPSLIELVDQCVERGEAPHSVYVFVDAITNVGGSQFLNSPICGNFEDYFLRDVYLNILNELNLALPAERVALMGGSSGGYGALHLGSKFPQYFGVIAATAPDCFFEASLYPDLLDAVGEIAKQGGVKNTFLAFKRGDLKKKKNFFKILNALAMTFCYSQGSISDLDQVEYPLELSTAAIKGPIWENWLEMDPVRFLPKRMDNLKNLKSLWIDSGMYDQFYLNFGSRQIDKILKMGKINYRYQEFEGSHFDLGTRRPVIWRHLLELGF